MKFVVLGLLLLVASPATAQQTSANEQALVTKLLKEIQEGLNCNTSSITQQAELAKAQARIKELEAKDKPPDGK